MDDHRSRLPLPKRNLYLDRIKGLIAIQELMTWRWRAHQAFHQNRPIVPVISVADPVDERPRLRTHRLNRRLRSPCRLDKLKLEILQSTQDDSRQSSNRNGSWQVRSGQVSKQTLNRSQSLQIISLDQCPVRGGTRIKGDSNRGLQYIPPSGRSSRHGTAAPPHRAADGLQLAAALTWARGRPPGHAFVSLDARLAEAARREGFDPVIAPTWRST